MGATSGIVLLCILNWFFAVTAGLLWGKPHIEYFFLLARGEWARLVLLCYALGALSALIGIGPGLLLGAIVGVMTIDPAGTGAMSLLGQFALWGMFLFEFVPAFAIGYLFDRKIFSLPQE